MSFEGCCVRIDEVFEDFVRDLYPLLSAEAVVLVSDRLAAAKRDLDAEYDRLEPLLAGVKESHPGGDEDDEDNASDTAATALDLLNSFNEKLEAAEKRAAEAEAKLAALQAASGHQEDREAP